MKTNPALVERAIKYSHQKNLSIHLMASFAEEESKEEAKKAFVWLSGEVNTSLKILKSEPIPDEVIEKSFETYWEGRKK